MKKILKNIFLFCLISGSVFYAYFFVFSYGAKITHPALTKQAAELYNKNNDIKISSEEIGWLEKGSIEEDADPRYLNHFYDPTAGKGLDGWDIYKQFNIKIII